MNQAVARIDERTEIAAGVRPAPPSTTPAPGPSRAPQTAGPRRRRGLGRYLRPGVVLGTALKGAAQVTWHAFQAVNRCLPYGVKQPK